MSALTGTLLKRGMEMTAYAKPDQEVKINIPGWGQVTLTLTALAFFGIMFTIEYTFGQVLLTLLMIESPQDNIDFQPLPTEDDGTVKDPETQGNNGPQFVTSSFRQTLRLLTSKGGFKGRFRGLSIYVVNAILVSWASMALTGARMSGTGLTVGVINIAAAVLCAALPLAWNHIVISEPSPKMWFRRLPTVAMWKKVALPTALFALCQQISIIIPYYCANATGMVQSPEGVVNLTPHEIKVNTLKAFGVLIISLVISVLLVLPATVTLTRVQASLLRDTEETIIPFDRTFSGKVVPEIVGGNGMIGMLDAWMTFDWSSRIRLVKAYAKIIALQTIVTLVFTTFFFGEILIIGVKNFKKFPSDGQD